VWRGLARQDPDYGMTGRLELKHLNRIRARLRP
jgi:hypothetical protein